MVNTGTPSGRCLTCKEDKAKCDLKKPCCGRCVRLNRTCGGYPDRWRLVHRQQDEIAAIRVQSRVTKRRAERNHQRAAEPRTSATSKSAAVCVSPAPAPLNVAVEVYYIPRFFSDYSANSGVAIYDALPVLASASPATCYSHALKAVAMASSSGLLCQSGLLTRARVSYGLALSNLQRAILDPEPLRDDSVLVTLFLLGFFEVVTQTLFDARLKTVELKCDPHSRGARALLQYRIRNRLDTKLDQSLFIFTRNVRLMQLFMADKSPASLLADFIVPFADWEHLPPLEPIIMGSITWVADLNNHADPEPVCDEFGCSTARTVSTLIDRARSLIVGLLQAAESVIESSEGMRFNGLLAVRNQTSAAMARSLYRTVALHLMDMSISLLRVSLSEVEGQTLEKALAGFVNWEILCEDLHVAIFGNHDASHPAESPMAFRALTMAWPMMAVARSKVSPPGVRLLAEKSLSHGANFMHVVKL